VIAHEAALFSNGAYVGTHDKGLLVSNIMGLEMGEGYRQLRVGHGVFEDAKGV